MVCMNNRVIIGARTLVPLSNRRKNGTEVPTPEGKYCDGTAPKGIHFSKVPAPSGLFEMKRGCI